MSVLTEAEDEQRICRFFNMRGGCWKGEMCPLEHVSNSGLLLDDGFFRVAEIRSD